MEALARRMAAAGIDPGLDFRIQEPGAYREDGWSALGSYRQEVRQRRDLVEELQQKGLLPGNTADYRVLDFGCGLGSTALALADKVFLAVAMDASRAHCISAAECADDMHAGNLAVLMGSLPCCPEFRTLPMPAGAFDLVISHAGFWLKDMLKLVPAWAELLRPGGRIILIYPRFWFSSDGLNPDEAELRSFLMKEVPQDKRPKREWVEETVRKSGLSMLYPGELAGIGSEKSTGIVFVSSGIVADKAEFAGLIGDFSRRWLLNMEVLVMWKK